MSSRVAAAPTVVGERAGTQGDPDPQALRTVRWVMTLIGAIVVLQRFAVPGTEIALLVPVVLLWCGLAIAHGVAVVDPTRLVLFVGAIAATGVAIVAQSVFVPDRFISFGSWGLVMVTSAPFVLRLVDRRVATYTMVLRHVVRWGLGIAVACMVFSGSQLAGLSYRDLLASVVPDSFLLHGFAISYPFQYGSEFYRANAWFGLEPSIISFQLGLAVVAALLLRRSLVIVGFLVLAMVTTFSGTGIMLVAVAVVVIVVQPRRRVLLKYAPPALIGVVALASTPFGLRFIARAGEVRTSDSSAALRFTQPYQVLWPRWADRVGTVLWGDGPGSSQQLITDTNIDGLLVPTVGKIFFDYGLIGGLVLAVFLITCYVGGPSCAFAFALFVSLWTIQAGLTTTVLVAPVVALVTLWSPRRGPQLEDIPAGVGGTATAWRPDRDVESGMTSLRRGTPTRVERLQ